MITPVLLCGGSGTRLWPLSRKSYPKQFVPLIGEETLFQASAKRLSGEGYNEPVIVTNADFRFIVPEQLLEVGIDPGAILIEPDRRNTAPAVLAAALYLAEKDSDALMLVGAFGSCGSECRCLPRRGQDWRSCSQGRQACYLWY